MERNTSTNAPHLQESEPHWSQLVSRSHGALSARHGEALAARVSNIPSNALDVKRPGHVITSDRLTHKVSWENSSKSCFPLTDSSHKDTSKPYPYRPVFFHKFKALPVEIRILIWKHYMQDDRILEVNHGVIDYQEQLVDQSSTAGYRWHYLGFTPRSCIPPAVLHVNKEARQAALEVYTQTRFASGSITEHIRIPTIFFNPETDIIYFNDRSCPITLARFIKYAFDTNVPVQRIAINFDGQAKLSCRYGNIETIDRYGQGTSIELRPSDREHLFRTLRGLPKAHNYHAEYPGCPELKHVYLVQPTKFRAVLPGEVGAGVAFREPVGEGDSWVHELNKKILREGMVKERPGFGFSFVTLAPKLDANDLRKYETFVFKADQCEKLHSARVKFDIFAARHSCEIGWGAKRVSGREGRLVIFGPKEGIYEVRCKID